MDKRRFLKNAALLGAGGLLLPTTDILAATREQITQDDPFEFKQVPLGFGYSELEPSIDALTMEIHYSKHHAAYTKNLNGLVKDNHIVEKDIILILKNISKYPVGVRNNGGGFYNHNFFWEILSPKGGGEPSGEIANAITADFGSFTAFKEQFSKAAASRFGSGWAWLILKDKKLTIISTPNQDCPWMDVAEIQGKPLLCIDVWEHAYYLKYQNKRADYIASFWNVVNWEKVNQNFL